MDKVGIRSQGWDNLGHNPVKRTKFFNLLPHRAVLQNIVQACQAVLNFWWCRPGMNEILKKVPNKYPNIFEKLKPSRTNMHIYLKD